MTTRKPPLRVARPDDKPRTPANISEALAGTSRDVLAAMRRALAKKLDDDAVASNSIASAYKELRELDRLIRLADHEDADEAPASMQSDRTFDASAI